MIFTVKQTQLPICLTGLSNHTLKLCVIRLYSSLEKALVKMNRFCVSKPATVRQREKQTCDFKLERSGCKNFCSLLYCFSNSFSSTSKLLSLHGRGAEMCWCERLKLLQSQIPMNWIICGETMIIDCLLYGKKIEGHIQSLQNHPQNTVTLSEFLHYKTKGCVCVCVCKIKRESWSQFFWETHSSRLGF